MIVDSHGKEYFVCNQGGEMASVPAVIESWAKEYLPIMKDGSPCVYDYRDEAIIDAVYDFWLTRVNK